MMPIPDPCQCSCPMHVPSLTDGNPTTPLPCSKIKALRFQRPTPHAFRSAAHASTCREPSGTGAFGTIVICSLSLSKVRHYHNFNPLDIHQDTLKTDSSPQPELAIHTFLGIRIQTTTNTSQDCRDSSCLPPACLCPIDPLLRAQEPSFECTPAVFHYPFDLYLPFPFNIAYTWMLAPHLYFTLDILQEYLVGFHLLSEHCQVPSQAGTGISFCDPPVQPRSELVHLLSVQNTDWIGLTRY